MSASLTAVMVTQTCTIEVWCVTDKMHPQPILKRHAQQIFTDPNDGVIVSTLLFCLNEVSPVHCKSRQHAKSSLRQVVFRSTLQTPMHVLAYFPSTLAPAHRIPSSEV